MKQLLICTSLLITSSCFTQIQLSRDVFATSGMEMSNSSLQVSFTAGETFTSTFVQGSTFTLGFQQNNESSVSLEEIQGVNISLYPNPATEQLILTTTSASPYGYKIYDITGRIVQVEIQILGDIIIDVTSLVEGKYFLEYIPVEGQNNHLQFILIH